MRTLITLTTEHDRPALIFVAICLWSRGRPGAHGPTSGAHWASAPPPTPITGDLQTAADDRYLDLLHWAIRTTTSLTETTAGPRLKSSRPKCNQKQDANTTLLQAFSTLTLHNIYYRRNHLRPNRFRHQCPQDQRGRIMSYR